MLPHREAQGLEIVVASRRPIEQVCERSLLLLARCRSQVPVLPEIQKPLEPPLARRRPRRKPAVQLAPARPRYRPRSTRPVPSCSAARLAATPLPHPLLHQEAPATASFDAVIPIHAAYRKIAKTTLTQGRVRRSGSSLRHLGVDPAGLALA